MTHTDANGRTRSAEYDRLGRIIERKNSTGVTLVSYQYSFVPNYVRTTTHTPTGNIWKEDHYDGLGRNDVTLSVGQRGGSDPIRVVQEFNDRGVPWKKSYPHWSSEAGSEHWNYTILENDDPDYPSGAWTRMGQNRTVKIWSELNSTGDMAHSQIHYESPLSEKSIRIDNELNTERRVIRDAFGNRIAVWEPDRSGSVGSYQIPQGQLTQYGYDAMGRLEFVRRHVSSSQDQDSDPVTNIYYDTLGRKIKMDDPDTGASLYRYDAIGNLTRSIDARGIEVARQYDNLNRLTRVVFPDVDKGLFQEHAYTYDSGDGNYLIGRLARVTSPASTVDYSYDREGRTELIRRSIDGITYETAMQYDYAGRQELMTYPDGMRLQYGYDTASQALDNITDPDTGQVWLADLQINQFGSDELLRLGNGVKRTVDFDYAGRAINLVTEAGSTILSDLKYTFDLKSNIIRIQEMSGLSPKGDMQYQYDAFDRLTAAWGTTMSGVDAGTQSAPAYQYSYDELGRMIANSRFLNSSFSDYALEYEYPSNPNYDGPAHAVSGIKFKKEGFPDVYAHQFDYDQTGNLIHSTNEAAALEKKRHRSNICLGCFRTSTFGYQRC